MDPNFRTTVQEPSGLTHLKFNKLAILCVVVAKILTHRPHGDRENVTVKILFICIYYNSKTWGYRLYGSVKEYERRDIGQSSGRV